MEPGLGVDFGGVIVEAATGSLDHPRTRRPTDVPPLQGVLDALRDAHGAFGGRVWILSKASHDTELWTRQWLRTHRLAEVTGIAGDHVQFVRDRTAKGERCRGLGITHFIDDRRENLEMLRGEVPHLYLFGGVSDDPAIQAVAGWSDARRLLFESLEKEGGARPN
jgi:hypothetical protein